MDADTDESGNKSPAEYLAMLRRRWWLLVLVPFGFAVATYWYASAQEQTYSASARLLVQQASTLGVRTASDIQAANLLTQTYSELATSTPVLERVKASLGLPYTVSELASYLTADAGIQTQLVTVTGHHPDPQVAASIANATAEAFVAWLAEHEEETTSESNRALQETLDEARTGFDETSAELAALRNKPGERTSEEDERIANLEDLLDQYRLTYTSLSELQQGLELERIEAQNRVTVATPALPPGSPSGRSTAVYAAIAFFFGLGVAGVGVVLMESLDKRVHGAYDVQRAVGAPVLAAIPRSRRLLRRSGLTTTVAPQSRNAVAFRLLGTGLQLAMNGRETTAIVVTSPAADGGASEVAANLAVSFGQLGRQVVLVDGNLQHARRRKAAAGLGLSNLLSEPTLPPERALLDGPHPSVRLLPAGHHASDTSGLLTGERWAQIVAGLGQLGAEAIVIDAPPIASAPESILFVAQADGVVVVAKAGRTRSDTLRATFEHLRFAGGNVLGVVLNGVMKGQPAV